MWNNCFFPCFALLFLAGSSAKSISANGRCSRYCKEHSTHKFKVGSVYTYKYEADLKTLLNATVDNSVGFSFNSTFNIIALSSCDLVLKVESVDFSEPQPLENDLKQNPLYFSFQNGRVNTICPTDDETTDILNIKRAILSAFQTGISNSKENSLIYETDISGNCETHYKVLGRNPLTVEKEKNLEACAHRTNQYLSWNSVPYNGKTKKKSPPLLRSTQNCLQTYTSDGVLHSSKCSERHGFQPLSHGNSGAVTYMTQNVKLVSSETTDFQENVNMPMNRRTSLLFENKIEIVEEKIQVENIIELLEDLKQKTTNGTEDDTPRLFSHLVYYVRNVDYQKLAEIWDMIRESPPKQKILLDAISLVSTPDGIKIMRKLYEEGEINEHQINSWVTSLAFTKNPSVEVLNEMKPLMTMSTNINQKAILSLSSLVHRFCQMNPECIKIPEINEIMTLLEAPIATNCAAYDSKRKAEILLALKGIGNAGITTSLGLLQRCYANEDLPIEIRLSAFAAHRRFSCLENKNLEDFLSYFANANENTEIRIAAYLSSMECASLSTYTLVKEVLHKEEMNQVGSFVWTHLSNLQETSSRWKQSLRLLTENYFLRNKFNTDIRKYSRNYEISSFFDSINMGGSVESNVIFTEASYLPRAAMFNLTLDLFGETVNVFEMDTRAEGLEDVVEKFFAPDGYFPEQSISTALQKARSEQESIQRIGETFKRGKKLAGDPNVLMSFKAFGNEFAYFGLDDLMGLLGMKRDLMDVLTRQISKQDIETTKSFVFLDSSVKVPTLLGLPLELSVNGTASLGLTARTNVDLKDLRGMKVAVEGKIYPSAVVEVIGAMTVSSAYSKVGLNLVGRMSSNSYIDGHAYIDGGKLVDVKLNVPKNKFNVFNVQSKIFKMKGNEMFEIKNTTDNVNTLNVCTPKNLNAVVGFEICSKLTYVNASTADDSPYFPLTGAFEYSLGLQKIDNFNNYIFNLKSENKSGRSISLFFDTPGSKTKRTVLAKYLLDWDNLLINAQFSCPFAKLELNSNLSNKTNRNIYIQAHFNNKELLLFQSSLSSIAHGNSWKYEPLARLLYKSSPIAAMSGSINFIRGSEYTVDLKLDGFAEDTILIKGALNHSHKKYEASASVRSPNICGNFTGSLLNTDQTFSLKFDANYSGRDSKKQSLGLVLESKTEQKGRSLYASFHSTQKPLYNTLMSLDYKWDDLYFEGNGRVRLFKTSWETRQLFKFKQGDAKYHMDLGVLCSLSCEEKDINYTVNLAYILSENRFGVHGLLQLNRRQRLEALAKVDDLFLKEKTFLTFVYYPEYTWMLEGNVKEKSEGVFSAYFSGNYELDRQKTTFLVFRGRYVNSSLETVQNHTISAIIEFPNSVSTPWYLNTMMQYSNDILLCTSQLSIESNSYLSHMVWMKSSVSLIVQKNQRRLFFISGGKSNNEYSGTIALNIYQHFELNTRLLMPYQSFLFEFFWDKDVSLDQKVSLAFEKDNLGRYTMDLQYPNQKIVATFVLLPSQVTVNITWGTHLSHRIYLEAGNKVYDVGGIWFAKLETPFEYLEKQEFLLHYYVLSDSAKLKTDIKWRNQSVNLQMSGLKTDSHVNGFFDMQTSLTEIRKAIAVVNYYKNEEELKSDAKFVFNDHELALASSWKSQGLNIVANFEMTSPTNSLLPIKGILLTDNNVTTKFLNCSINWQGKPISLDYRFEKPHSHIRIVTPFEGIEETQFDYTLVAEVERLVLELKANLLQQENWALLSWDTEKEAVGVKFQVLSPITGNYRAVFKHSTILGHLAEYLIVTQGKDDILALKLYGDLLPLQKLDLTVDAVLLGYTLSVGIKNEQNPTTTTIKVQLNQDFILCKSVVVYENDSLANVNLNVTSNILEKAIEFRYMREESKCVSSLSLPNGYTFKNNLMIEGLSSIEDNFEALTPQGNGLFKYSHKLTNFDFNHLILIQYDGKECRYAFYYNINEYLKFLVDKVNLKISTPWYHDVQLDFSITTESIPLNVWRPQLYFVYDNKNPISLTSSITYEPFNSYLALEVQVSERSILELNMSYDFTKRLNKLRFWLQKHNNSRYSLICDFKISDEEGFVLVRVSNSTRNLVDGSFEYSLQAPTRRVLLSWEVFYESLAMKLNAQGALSDQMKGEVEMSGSLPQFYAGVLLGLSTLPHKGYMKYGRHTKFVVLDYDLEEFNKEVFVLTARLTSQFPAHKNGTIAFRGENIANKNRFSITGNYDKEKVAADIVYSLTTSILKGKYISKFAGGLNLNCSGGARVVNLISEIDSSVVSDKNSSKIDATFKSNIPHLKIVNLATSNKNSRNSYEFDAKLTHENKIYTVSHSIQHADQNLALSTLVTTPFFGNASALLNCRNNKAKMKAIYSTNTKTYTASAQSEFSAFKGNSVFSVVTPTNTYTGALDLDITGKNRYVLLTVVFPKKIANIIEIRLGEHLWPNLITRIRLFLPSFSLPVYSLDLNCSYLTGNGLFLLEYAKHKVEVRKTGNNFLLAFDVPSKKNYVFLNGSHSFTAEGSFVMGYAVSVEGRKLEVDLKGEMLKHLKAKAVLKFGDVTADVALDDILNATLVFDRKWSVKMLLDKNSLFLNKNLLDVRTNEGPLITIWSGSRQSFLFAKYKSDNYNLSLAHDINNRIGFTFNKNSNQQIVILGTWDIKGDDFVAKGAMVLSHSALTKLNITTQFRKDENKYAADVNISNGLRYILKTAGYFEITVDSVYSGYLKVNTPSEILQSLELFGYASTEKTHLETKLLIEHHYTTNEYFARINLLDAHNLILDLKYPCPFSETCKFYLQYKPNYFEMALVGPVEKLQNFSVLAALTKNDVERGVQLQLKINEDFAVFYYNLSLSTKQVILYTQIKNTVLPTLTYTKINCIYNFYKSLQLTLDLGDLENKFTFELKENVLNIAISLLNSLVDLKSSVGFVWQDNLKTLDIKIVDIANDNDSATLKTRLEKNQKNITFIFYTTSSKFNFDTRALLTPTNKQIFVKLDKTVILNVEALMLRSSHKNEESMYVNAIFEKNVCKFNISYNQETRMFNLTNLQLKNRNDIEINAYGGFALNKGDLKVNVNGSRDFNLLWVFGGVPQNRSCRVEFASDRELYGLVVDIVRPSSFAMKVYTPNNNSTLNLNYSSTDSGADFTGDLAVFLNQRLYNLKNKFGYNFKNHLAPEKVLNLQTGLYNVKNVVYNKGVFDFLLQSNFIVRPALANLEYSVNALDFNNIEGLKLNATCPACQPSTISFKIASPVSSFKNLHLIGKLHHDLKHANFTLEKDGVRTEAQLFVNANDNTCNIQLKSKNNNKTLGQALIILQNSQRKLKGTANINFSNIPFTTSLNFEPNKFKVMLNSPLQRLRNLKLSGSYSPRDFKTEGVWNNAKINAYAVLKAENKNDAYFTSQIEIGDNIKGVVNVKKTKSEMELFAYLPDKTVSVFARYNQSDCKIVFKTPFEKVKEIYFDGKYNESWIDLRLAGNAFKEDFLLSANAFTKTHDNFAVNAGCTITNRNLNWALFGIFDVYKHSVLKLTGATNTTASYTINKLRSGVAFDAYLKTTKENNTLGFIWSADPHYEFYINDNKVSQKITKQNGLMEAVAFVRIPFFNITEAGFLVIRDVFNGGIRNKYFYNECYIDFEHRNTLDVKLKYYIPHIKYIQQFLHVESFYTEEKLFLKECSRHEICNTFYVIYANNASDFKFEIYDKGKDATLLCAMQFAKSFDKFHFQLFNQLLFHLEYFDYQTSKLRFLVHYSTPHEVLVEFKEGEVYLQIASRVLPLNPLSARFAMNKTENSDVHLKFDVKTSKNVDVISFLFTFERLPNACVVEVGVNAYNKTVYTSSVKVVQTKMTEVFATGFIFDQKTKLYMVFSKSNPYLLGVTINNHFLPDGGFTFEALISKLNKVFLFIGSGYSDLLQNGLISTDSHDKYLTLYGFYENRTFNAKTDLRGFDYFKAIDVDFKFLQNSEATIYNASLAIISPLFGNSSTGFAYISNETSINIYSHLHTPRFNKFDVVLQLPVSKTDVGYYPKFALNAFNHTYAVEASYKNSEKRKNVINLGYEFFHLKFDGTLEVAFLPKFSLFLNATTKNNHLEAALNKNANSERSLSYLLLNKKYYEFVHGIVFRTTRKLVDVSFTMPHANFSNYSLTFELTNSENKLLKFYVGYPTFGNKRIGFEFGFSPVSLTNFTLLSRISLPAFIQNFTEGELSVRHVYNQQKHSKTYFLQCQVSTNQHIFLLNINADDVINLKKFTTAVKVDENAFQVKLESSGSNIAELQAEFSVVTPLKVLEQLSLHLNSTKIDGQAKYSCGFDYNFAEVFKGTYQANNYTHLVGIITPWKTLGGEYRYVNEESEFHVKGLVYWDKNSQIGGHVYMGDYFAVGAVLPTRVCGVESSYISNKTDEMIFGRVYWNANDSIALRIAFKNITTGDVADLQYHTALDTPFRSLEYSYKMQLFFTKGARFLVYFKWDKTPSSQLFLDTYLSNGNLQTKLSSPLLLHDIALNISMSALSDSLSKLRIELEYSEQNEKRLIFETCYQKTYTNIFATQRKILIQHPASKIDYLLDFGTVRTEDFTNGTFTLQYTNFFTNSPEQINAFITIAHKKLAVWGRIKTHKNDLSVKMKSNTEADLNSFTVLLQMNDKDPLTVNVQYKFRHTSPAITATVSYGTSRSYKMFLGLPTRKEVIASLTNETYNDEAVDSLFTAKLNSSQLLWIKLQWRRDVINRFYKVLLAEYSDLRFVIEAIGRELIEVIDDDFGSQLISDVSYMRSNLGSYVKREAKEFKERYSKFSVGVKEGIKRNAFYAKDIFECLKVIGANSEFLSSVAYPVIDTIKFAYEIATYTINDAFVCVQYVGTVIHQHVENIIEDVKDVRKLKENAKHLLKMGIEDTQRALKDMQKLALEKINMLEFYVGEIKEKIENFFEPCLNVLDDFIVYVEQRLAIMQLILLDILDTVQSYIANLQEMQDLIKAYSIYFSWLEEFHLIDLLEPVGNAIECVLEEIVDDFRRVYDDYRPYLEALYDAIFGRYEQFIQLPPISELRKFCNRIYQKTVWFWKYHNLSEAIKNYIRDLFTNIDDFLTILLELENLSGEDFETILQNADYVYKPEQGYVECSLPLVVEWQSFDTLPKFEQHSLYQKIQKKLNHLQQIQGYFAEVVNSLRSLAGFAIRPELSPSVNNYATIIGGEYFITFDGYSYNFTGDCSYLLAGDFKTNAFSLTINYANGQMRSLSVDVYNNTIELSKSFDVALNGKSVDLPIFLNTTTVTRNYKTITVKNTKGLTLICDYHYDICTIELSRWLFGKTGGLLGTLDNEKATDLIFPNGTKTSSISHFIESWSVSSSSKKCEAKTKETKPKTQLSPLEEELTDALCNALFEYRNSPLSDCFHRINPESFLNICLSDVRSASNGSVCSAVVAYARMCSSFNIAVKIPEMCINCPSEDVEIGPNEEIFDGHNPSAVDVVFIYDDSCVDAFMSTLSLDVEEALIQQGFYSKRYAYVGYGISGAYIATQQNSVWSDASEDLHFQKRETASTTLAVDAIKFALKLDFRPRVSKIFVLLQCQACPHVDNIHSIYNMLGEKDVTLHVITSLPEFASDYSAIDANGNVMYQHENFVTTKNVTTAQNNLIINEISDSCSLLALGTNGTVSSLNDFSKSTSFREKWAHFGMRTLRNSPCQKCKCVPDEFGIGRVECARCMAPAVKYMLNEYESNIIKYGA